MIKLFLAFSILSSSAFAGVILEKHKTSGFVLPEHRFVKDCYVKSEGFVESYTKQADGTIMGFTHQVSQRKIWEIKQLLKVARKASIVSGAIRCDGGSESVTGHRNNKPVMLKDLKDCASNTYRTGWAANRLRNIASNLCAF